MNITADELKGRSKSKPEIGEKELTVSKRKTNNDSVMPMSKKHDGVTFISAMAEIEYQTAIWLKDYYN